jgi:hypothetical protein
VLAEAVPAADVAGPSRQRVADFCVFLARSSGRSALTMASTAQISTAVMLGPGFDRADFYRGDAWPLMPKQGTRIAP